VAKCATKKQMEA